MSAVAVLIVNYETRDALRSCLCAVSQSGAAEIVVVDNTSSDGSAAMVEAEFPSIRLIANQINVGYGRALNQAAAMTTAPVLLCLNADTELALDSCERLARYLDEHPRVGLVGPRLVKRDGRLQSSCRPFPGTFRWSFDNEVIAPGLARLPGLHERLYVTWRHDSPRRVPWVVGAAIAVRRTAFEDVGGFDERLFLYFEEVDLCYRLWRQGWEVHFAPVTTVVHGGGESTVRARADNEIRLLAGHLLFLRLHFSAPRRLAATAALKLLEGGRLVTRGLAVVRADDELARTRARADFSACARRLLHTW